ncbi:hypothetical protein HPB49_001869 [Dermacentor silvarum]|uniref:Uncharacterized protein n=1 Tax=Dermacentor silvarum TaxID=543639 RepID=A0ACB8D2G6_DERSI|nr:hypothetical protein HPB49_001869 [Dermacentor silvarum]
MARWNRLENYKYEPDTEPIIYRDPKTGEHTIETLGTWVLCEEDVGEEELANFYKKDPKEKPRVSLAIRKDDATIGARVQASIIKGTIGGDMAAAFLFKIAGTIKHQLTTNFELDGILIKRAGETVTPLNLIDVHVTDIASYDLDLGAADDTLCNDLTAAFVLCYAHRVSHLAGTVGNNDYIGRLVTKGMAIAGTSPMNGAKEAIRSTLLASRAFSADLVNHPGFCGLLVALDMFFLNFPNHALSKFRIATLQMYCKGYTVLNDLTYMNEITGMERSEWSQGIFVEEITAAPGGPTPGTFNAHYCGAPTHRGLAPPHFMLLCRCGLGIGATLERHPFSELQVALAGVTALPSSASYPEENFGGNQLLDARPPPELPLVSSCPDILFRKACYDFHFHKMINYDDSSATIDNKVSKAGDHPIQWKPALMAQILKSARVYHSQEFSSTSN